MFNKADDAAESVIAQHSQQSEMQYTPPIYLKNGPIQQRSCTDLFCCLIFMIIMGSLGYFYFLAYTKQHLERLYLPVDSEGNECGDGKLEDYRYIYFVTPDQSYLYRTVCVKQCPTERQPLQCFPNKQVPSCASNLSPTDLSKQVLIYDSKAFNNICLPQDPKLLDNIRSAAFVGEIQNAFVNLQNALPVLGISAGIAFGLCLIFTILLGLFTTFITWIFLISYVGLTGFASFYFFLYFINKPPNYLQFPYMQQQQESFAFNFYILGISGIFGALNLYALFNICYNFTRIKFMISLIKLATKFIYQNKFLILVPIFFFILIIFSLFIWLASSLLILSENQIDFQSRDKIFPFERINPTSDTILKLILSFIGMIWLRLYIISFARFLTVSTTTIWYFMSNKIPENEQNFLSQSFQLALRYHNGSIVAEAIYTFLFGFISKTFNLIYDTLYKYKMKRHSPILHCMAQCLLLICCPCEKFIMFIGTYAFVQIVMTSQNFFTASQAVYYTIKRNQSDYSRLSGLGVTFTHFGKMFIFLASSVLSFYIMISNPKYNDSITKPLYPVIAIGFITLSISTLFMDMFGQSADGLILAYFTDCEVERYHFGRDECGSCPEQIRETITHIRKKKNQYYG